MSLTNDYEDIVGNLLLRNTSHTPAATVYVALFTASPGETGSTTDEVSGGDYARQAVSFSAPSTAGTFTNSADVQFPTATASWGTVSHMAVMTDSTGGSVIVYGALLDPAGSATTKAISAGDSLSIAAGNLTVTFA